MKIKAGDVVRTTAGRTYLFFSAADNWIDGHDLGRRSGDATVFFVRHNVEIDKKLGRAKLLLSCRRGSVSVWLWNGWVISGCTRWRLSKVRDRLRGVK